MDTRSKVVEATVPVSVLHQHSNMASCLFQNCRSENCVVCGSRIDSIVLRIDSIVTRIDSIVTRIDSIVINRLD